MLVLWGMAMYLRPELGPPLPTGFSDLNIDLPVLATALSNSVAALSKHGLDVPPPTAEDVANAEGLLVSYASNPEMVKKAISAQVLTKDEISFFKYRTLIELGKMYHGKGWVQQFHIGALRNNNARIHRVLGPDTGWDSIGDYPQAEKLSAFLNALDSKDKLTKTIIYNLNPADNEVMATMIGNFNDGSVKGKVQWGSGWWFQDQKDGMIKQLNTLSNMGLISCFIGMLTDSRSFLSFPRHEYFRRILCNLIGDEIKRGELPNDMEWIGKLVSDISYYNAKDYFKI